MAGPLTDDFEVSLAVKLRAYAHLYLHMPLKLTITLASATVRHVVCEPPRQPSECDDGVGPLLLGLCGAVLLQLGLLHVLSADSNTRRASIRVGSGLKLWAIAFSPWPVERFAAMAIIVGVLGGQALADYLHWAR